MNNKNRFGILLMLGAIFTEGLILLLALVIPIPPENAILGIAALLMMFMTGAWFFLE